jgi:hypothetical protein
LQGKSKKGTSRLRQMLGKLADIGGCLCCPFMAKRVVGGT